MNLAQTLWMVLADLWAERSRTALSLLTLTLMAMGYMILAGFAESVRLFSEQSADRRDLVMVERGEAPLGLVYATDAAISQKVRVVGTFPADSHPPIVYPVAVISGSKMEAAKQFVTFLKSQEARAIFEKYGFDVR